MTDLVVTDISKQYATRTDPVRVLRRVSFELSAGQSMAVVGPSGSGKSTLLHILGTLDEPTSGTVSLQGTDLASLSDEALADFRNRTIGFVFQDHHLLPQCTALENVLLPAIARGPTSRDDVTRAQQLLDRVGLSDRREHRPAEMSGGERQRVAVARALLYRPALLLADEPTGNLDRRTGDEIGNLLLDLPRTENTMLIVVTHSSNLAGRLGIQYELDDGQLHVRPASPQAG